MISAEPSLAVRSWVPAESERLAYAIAGETSQAPVADAAAMLDGLIEQNRRIHDVE